MGGSASERRFASQGDGHVMVWVRCSRKGDGDMQQAEANGVQRCVCPAV
jgi:hypothetical protein